MASPPASTQVTGEVCLAVLDRCPVQALLYAGLGAAAPPPTYVARVQLPHKTPLHAPVQVRAPAPAPTVFRAPPGRGSERRAPRQPWRWCSCSTERGSWTTT